MLCTVWLHLMGPITVLEESEGQATINLSTGSG